MITKRHFIAALAAVMALTCAQAQDYYDLTEYYIENADFTANVVYDSNSTEDVPAKTVNTPNGWTLDPNSKSNFTVASTFRYGTKATFMGKSIPATGPDGATGGACLTLCGAYSNKITFYQAQRLPAGEYMLLVTYYNCNEAAEEGTSLSGWYVTDLNNTLSQTTTFGIGEWRTDTIRFTLDDFTVGRLQVGYKGSGKVDSKAMLAIDNVRLLRNTPYGDQDNMSPAPEVVTNTLFARGATMAFGRIKSVKGDEIKEQGFCWAETPEPTVGDNTTTDIIDHEGAIYVMKDLKPATIYYMRAYAKNAYGKVGYGDIIKFATVKKGNVTFWYNNGGDDAANKRVNAAAQEACDIFSNLTEMVKKFNIGYSAGTPTADCYYGDEPWMNMGANSSYQRTGTIMHEMQHGFGVIPYDTQWAGNILRSGNGSGDWLGDRVSAFLDFWDNTTGSRLHGDNQHMWPYGINGANEDHGNIADYYANAMIGQALGEDGLEHRSNTFAEPYYALTQDDNTKYYLKCEAEDRGLYTSYLTVTKTGTLKWIAMSATEAQANDSAAWFITFTPENQYYQLRNAATGQYMTYSGGFKTVTRTATTDNDNFHLMRGRIDVGSGETAKRAYWLIHPTGDLSPNCLQANGNGVTGSATFDLKNTATRQRWLILTAEEATQQETVAMEAIKAKVSTLLAEIKKLALVPHTQLKAGTDNAFADALTDIEERMNGAAQTADLTTLQDEANQAALDFLCNVHATDKAQPFNLTYMVKSQGMDSTDGWTGTPSLAYSSAEFYERTFNFYQSINNLPGGEYQLLAQGFQRPGSYTNAYNDYAAGNNNVTAELYAGAVTNATKLKHIAEDAQKKKVGKGVEKAVGSTVYIPDNMEAASAYFAKGLYENSVDATLDKDGGSLRIGIRSTSMPASYWVIFDNFRLHFFGKDIEIVKGDVNGDGAVDVADIASVINVMAGSADVSSAQADVNGDGVVDVADIATIINEMAARARRQNETEE